MKKIVLSLAILWHITHCAQASEITPGPIISRGRTVYTSKGNAPYLVDNKFNTSSFTVTNNSWVAIKVGAGPSKIFFTWNNPAYSWSDVIAAANSCKGGYSLPVNYTMQTSSNSTNGSDGTWATAVTVSNNTVTARGHLINFSDASWIKMNISTGGGSLDEIEVFNVSNEGNDLWFFTGTSISANTYKATPPDKNFADLINASFPGLNPAMIRGGIPCIFSGDVATDISKYLSVTRNVKYWAIEMGTNDAWGGTRTNVKSFAKNMQLVIDSCKAAGIKPILARMIGTNSTAAGWQVHPDFLTTIDSLATVNNLIEGPDLYTWFTTHPAELNTDGVHPNATGAASIQKLWAEKMASLYPPGMIIAGLPTENVSDKIVLYPNPSPDGDFKLLFHETRTGSDIQIYDLLGKLVFNTIASENETLLHTLLPRGMYLVKISADHLCVNKKIIIK